MANIAWKQKDNNENKRTNQTDGLSPECIDKLAASELYLAVQWLQHHCNTSSEDREYEERA